MRGHIPSIDDRPGCCDWEVKVVLFDLNEMRR